MSHYINFATLISGSASNTAVIQFNTSSNYTTLLTATIEVEKETRLQINAGCRYRLANNQEANIRLMNGSTQLFGIGNTSQDTSMIRTDVINTQITLAPGTHTLSLQIRGYNGNAGIHRVEPGGSSMTFLQVG